MGEESAADMADRLKREAGIGEWDEVQAALAQATPCNACGEKPTIERLKVGDHQMVLDHAQNACDGRTISIPDGSGEGNPAALVARWNDLFVPKVSLYEATVTAEIGRDTTTDADYLQLSIFRGDVERRARIDLPAEADELATDARTLAEAAGLGPPRHAAREIRGAVVKALAERDEAGPPMNEDAKASLCSALSIVAEPE